MFQKYSVSQNMIVHGGDDDDNYKVTSRTPLYEEDEEISVSSIGMEEEEDEFTTEPLTFSIPSSRSVPAVYYYTRQQPPRLPTSYESPYTFRPLHVESSDYVGYSNPTTSNIIHKVTPLDEDGIRHHHSFRRQRTTCLLVTKILSTVCFIALAVHTATTTLYPTNSSSWETEVLIQNFSNKQLLESFDKDMQLLLDKMSALEEQQKQRRRQQQQQQQEEQSHLRKPPPPPTSGGEEEEEVTNLEETIHTLKDNAEALKAQVQAFSKKEILQKYGPGIHRVEIELEFPFQENAATEVDGPTKFMIELAPIELMPHSVNFFLDIVSLGLLDGCSFVLHALHVLRAAPLPYDPRISTLEKAKSFADHGLESVAFKEYHHNYPHEPYTLGFAVDGSPSFYINTKDNSHLHVGQPCFGKIISGWDTIERLQTSPIRNGIWFQQRIGIKHASIL